MKDVLGDIPKPVRASMPRRLLAPLAQAYAAADQALYAARLNGRGAAVEMRVVREDAG
jgi:predicted signal transduction protein with EAL and GGDEF domain